MILFLLLTPVALEACVATIPTETVHPTTRAAEMEETTTVAATSMPTAASGGGEACPCISYPPETPRAYAEERILPMSPKTVLPNYVMTSSSAGCSFRVQCTIQTTDPAVLDRQYPYIVVKTADGTDSTVVLLSDARLSCNADKWYDNGLELILYSLKMTDSEEKKKEKRLDLQGIRGIAILSVIGFHYLPNLFPNGYVGVDQ
uniref:ZP domain-containing protein n=1 Tax=Caenorhabditis tropicalis TaxID=1561998 RepID=A0A1I7UEB2_9PELO